eukprot:6366160-Pyramimonas_sp.AAC.1
MKLRALGDGWAPIFDEGPIDANAANASLGRFAPSANLNDTPSPRTWPGWATMLSAGRAACRQRRTYSRDPALP